MKPLLPPDVFKAELRKLYDALRYNAACDKPHDRMYAVICKGWDLGGVGTCERLEYEATKSLGFDRQKISWLPDYIESLRACARAFGDRAEGKSKPCATPHNNNEEVTEDEIPD